MAGRGPATVRDFVAWSGLPAADCRLAFDLLASELLEVDAAGTAMVALAETDLTPPAETTVRLVGMWDEYLLSHRSRGLILDPAVADRILVGGVIQAAVLVDGRVAGLWRLQGTGRRRRLVVEAFTRLSRPMHRAIGAEADDIGRFLGADIEVSSNA